MGDACKEEFLTSDSIKTSMPSSFDSDLIILSTY